VTPRERRLWEVIQRTTQASMQRLQLPTISDVISRRREVFKEAVRETLAGGGLESYVIMAEEMSEEIGPTELAAAAFKMLLGVDMDETEDKLIEPPRPEYDDRNRSGKGGSKRRDFGPQSGMTRLYIDIGREDGVRPADLVGAIANEANIPGRSIGAIELFDHFSLVDVPSGQSKQVIHALKGTRIRNRKVSPSLAKPKSTSGSK
jgi:ATP-dependent RNA helicase DeaD